MDSAKKAVLEIMQGISTPESVEQSTRSDVDDDYVSYLKNRITRMIPKRFLTTETDTDIKPLLDKSLFIYGAVGVGKSVLMASLVKHYIKHNQKCLWVSYPRFIMQVQGMFGKDSLYVRNIAGLYDDFDSTTNPYEYADKVSRFKGYLAIDDLGAEKPSEFVRQITYSIINEREQNELPILITSNRNLDDVDRMIDERVSSRICGICDVINLKGADRRKVGK